MADGSNDFITADELCTVLKLPKNFIYEHTRKGSADPIPGAYKFGKHLRFKRVKVAKWIEDHCKD